MKRGKSFSNDEMQIKIIWQLNLLRLKLTHCNNWKCSFDSSAITMNFERLKSILGYHSMKHISYLFLTYFLLSFITYSMKHISTPVRAKKKKNTLSHVAAKGRADGMMTPSHLISEIVVMTHPLRNSQEKSLISIRQNVLKRVHAKQYE